MATEQAGNANVGLGPAEVGFNTVGPVIGSGLSLYPGWSVLLGGYGVWEVGSILVVGEALYGAISMVWGDGLTSGSAAG